MPQRHHNYMILLCQVHANYQYQHASFILVFVLAFVIVSVVRFKRLPMRFPRWVSTRLSRRHSRRVSRWLSRVFQVYFRAGILDVFRDGLEAPVGRTTSWKRLENGLKTGSRPPARKYPWNPLQRHLETVQDAFREGFKCTSEPVIKVTFEPQQLEHRVESHLENRLESHLENPYWTWFRKLSQTMSKKCALETGSGVHLEPSRKSSWNGSRWRSRGFQVYFRAGVQDDLRATAAWRPCRK